MHRYFWLVLLKTLLLMMPFEAHAQQDTIVKKIPVIKQSKDSKKKAVSVQKISEKALDLEQAIKDNDNPLIAKRYEQIAELLAKRGNTAKAEENYKKALDIYTRLKQNDDMSRVSRSLAKIQETQGKEKEASLNYKAASEVTTDKKLEELNSNDFRRLSNSANYDLQKGYLDSNIKILEKADKKEELSDAYVQKAETSLKSKDKAEALKSYNNAIVFVSDKPSKVIEIKNKIANVYAADNEFDKAIEINENLLKEAEKNSDFETQIKEKQLLAGSF